MPDDEKPQFEKPEKTISRSGFGLGVGAFMGYVFGGLSGAGMGAAAGLALAAMSHPEAEKGVFTAERKALFERAMQSEGDPEKIEKLAEAFEHEELRVQAELLRQRAALRRLPPEQVKKREQWFYRALCSSKPEAVDKLAEQYKNEGAIVAYRVLRDHAAALRGLVDGKIDDATYAEFEKKDMLARETFGQDSKEAASARKNLDAANQCRATDPSGGSGSSAARQEESTPTSP